MKFNTTLKGRIPPKVIDYLLQEGEYCDVGKHRRIRRQNEKGYKMSPKKRKEVLKKLVGDPKDVTIDLFASHSDNQERKYMTVENSAWNYDWKKLSEKGDILWANPLFQDVEKVITKACLEPCKLILVTPDWKNESWRATLRKIAIDTREIKAGIPLYERATSSQLLAGPRWNTHVTLLDTTKRTLQKYELDYQLIEEVKMENKNWGHEELKQNMEKYPGKKPKTVIIDRVLTTGKRLQLLMDISMKLPSGEKVILHTLADTGAQTNLIKKGLIENWEFERAQEPLRLTMANGGILQGGDRTLGVEMIFQKETDSKNIHQKHWVNAEFYEADITVDAILGFPWMDQKKIGVFPHLDALAMVGNKRQVILLKSTCPKRDIQSCRVDEQPINWIP